MARATPDFSAQQLSLFDSPAAASPPPQRAPLVSAPGQLPVATAPRPAAKPGSGSESGSESESIDAGRAPVRLQHPQAQRTVLLQGQSVAYAFRRARRRSIGFVIGTEGLSVAAPRWVGLAEVEGALQAKADWILRKLHEQFERGQRLQASRVVWRDGTSLPFLGETVIVVLDPRATGAVLNSDASSLPGVPRLTLHVGLPPSASQEQIREAVQSWLQRQARRIFEERCGLFAARLGVRMKRLSLSSAATRWGSASADGSVRLNWRLVHFALPVIDYVVAHELAHLREMNHSPAFWDVVRSVLPDFERSRGVLKSEPLPPLD